LVERGARTLLWHEAALGLMPSIARRFEAGAPPQPEELSGPLWNACHGGQLAVAQYLLARGADPNWPAPWSGQTPLDIAAQAERYDVVAWLLGLGAVRGKKGA
jgi:ankyrin repeat protein